MNAILIKTSTGQEQNGRVQKQLEVQTLIRAFCHEYYKLLLPSALFPHSAHITAFCHLELAASAGHFQSLNLLLCKVLRALASTTANVHVLSRQTSSR